MTDQASDPTLQRRRQRRPDLQSTFDIPVDVRQTLQRVTESLRAVSASAALASAPSAVKAARVTDAALLELAQPSLTPEQQLHAVSKVTGAVREIPKAQLAAVLSGPSGALHEWAHVLSLQCVVPLLLDCRLRYLHRALMTLLRTLLPAPDASTRDAVRDLYVARVLRSAQPATSAAAASTATTTTTAASAAALYFPAEALAPAAEEGGGASDVDAERDRVLNFLNGVDGLTSTLMPMMPTIFTDTFAEVLPLLADALQWVVVNATSHSRTNASGVVVAAAAPPATAAAAGTASCDGADDGETAEAAVATDAAVGAGTVFGEDLEHIRFCVRVVATYIHKYMDALTCAVAAADADAAVRRELARLLQPTIVMLSSPIFPKDVLNAVGLLVASILTVRTCDAWLLAGVCAALQDDLARCAAQCTEPLPSAAPLPLPTLAAVPLADLFAHTDVALRVVTAARPQEAALADGGAGARALRTVFSQFTPNGCFALLKGVLAHTSGPIRGDEMSLGVLLTPLGPCDGTAGGGDVVAYDIILPAAQLYCNVVQEPETRFMAIQTVDSVVRHVNAVLSTAAKALTAAPLSSTSATGSSSCSSAALRHHLASLCTPSPKLQGALEYATQLIMALWDDGTQQMSGALYGTYGEILAVHATLRRSCGDTAVTLDQILRVQAERRGKYHALLGLLSMMPLPEFLAVLQQHYKCRDSAANAVAAFARALLAGASNHKIGNVAGDVFAQLARGLAKSAPAEGTEPAAVVLQRGLIEPLARAIAERGFVEVASNVSDAVNISHVTAHFVAPLVKQDPTSLRAVLAAITAHLDSAAKVAAAQAERERVEQGVVEVLSRARSVGVDIVPYLVPGSTVLAVLESSARSLHYEVRHAALCLCVLGVKKIQAVLPWQMATVEEYLILNMHLGGDSTARKALLEMFKKWVRRLMESYTSKGGAAAAGGAAPQPAKKGAIPRAAALLASAPSSELPLELGTAAYRRAVMAHCRRLARIFAENIGSSASAGLGLSVERRVTAMMAYSALLHGLRTHAVKVEAVDWTAGDAGDAAAGPLLCRCTVPALIATLSDGWAQARDSAKELLHTFCELAPPEGALAEASGSAAAAAAVAEQAYQDLLRAQTFRNAEGAVARYLLFTSMTAEAQAAAQAHPHDELARLGAVLERERVTVADKCNAMSGMRGSAAYAFIQANPLHGSLSLCAELLGLMAEVERRATGAAAAAAAVDATPSSLPSASPPLTAACTDVLRCCCVVLRTCSSLVGTDTVASSSAAEGAEDEVVDCRGHVYDRSRPEAESVMRGVVNNTWLSMRVATSTVVRVLKVRPVHALPFAAVHVAAYELVHALLLTKHNGVMRCVREALKALAATLMRSRQPQYYQLPAELLDFLMGPEGVTSGDVARMLRRSQGLPHAILAVLEAEDTSVPYSLFPAAMRQLLRVARGGAAGCAAEQDTERVRRSQRSNALNVLKFVFEDRVFADRIVAHVEEAFSLATEGFHGASWYTRNSSLMLFSAVIHRFVGEHPSTGGSGVNTSLHDVAKRTPRGVAYAYAELTRGNGLVAGAEVNVALFPVLQLLSMLSPDPPHLTTKVSDGEVDDAARMAAAVMRCANSPSLMVRSASAVALCCLVPLDALRGTIAQTRRGLSLTPLHASAEEEAECGGSGGRLNACHSAVLQLLQFHAQYVGTLRRHYRQKRSSYATPAVAETVSRAIADVVLACRPALVQACAVSPTVAAAIAALLADLVHYGPRHGLADESQGAVRGLCVEVLTAYLTARHGVLERGSVMEGLSAVLVFLAAQRRTAAVGQWTEAEAAQLAALLASEAAALSIRGGAHTLISWVMAQLLHYAESNAVFSKSDVAAVLEVLSSELHCDVQRLALCSLADFLGAAARQQSTPSVGCIAWGQLVTHLRFAAATLDAACCGTAAVASVTAVAELRESLLHLLAPATQREDGSGAAPVSLSPWHNSDACSAALDFVTAYDIFVADSHAVSPSVARVLAYYCAPEQPLESRLAVVKALRTAAAFLRTSVAAATAASSEPTCPASAVTLLVVLLRLLVDDTFDIRTAAAAICSRCIWGPTEAPRDQVSCLLAVVRLLHRLHGAGALAGTEDLHAILALAGAPPTEDLAQAAAAEGDEAASDSGDEDAAADDGEDDVLFQKEAANMFAEETIMARLVAYIVRSSSSSSACEPAAGAAAAFTVYDAFLV